MVRYCCLILLILSVNPMAYCQYPYVYKFDNIDEETSYCIIESRSGDSVENNDIVVHVMNSDYQDLRTDVAIVDGNNKPITMKTDSQGYVTINRVLARNYTKLKIDDIGNIYKGLSIVFPYEAECIDVILGRPSYSIAMVWSKRVLSQEEKKKLAIKLKTWQGDKDQRDLIDRISNGIFTENDPEIVIDVYMEY